MLVIFWFVKIKNLYTHNRAFRTFDSTASYVFTSLCDVNSFKYEDQFNSIQIKSNS